MKRKLTPSSKIPSNLITYSLRIAIDGLDKGYIMFPKGQMFKNIELLNVNFNGKILLIKVFADGINRTIDVGDSLTYGFYSDETGRVSMTITQKNLFTKLVVKNYKLS